MCLSCYERWKFSSWVWSARFKLWMHSLKSKWVDKIEIRDERLFKFICLWSFDDNVLMLPLFGFKGIDFDFSKKLFVFVMLVETEFFIWRMLMIEVGLIESLIKFIFLCVIRVSVDSFAKLTVRLFLFFCLLVTYIQDRVFETHFYKKISQR